MVGQCRAGLVGIEVEERFALAANEVVGGSGSAACDADGLRVCKAGLEGFVVDWRDAIWSQSYSEEDESWFHVALGAGCGYGAEAVFVDVGCVGSNIHL